MSDQSKTIVEQVADTRAQGKSLSIHGSGSHTFMLPDFEETALRLDMTTHSGIIDYQPTELILQARSGTPVTEIKEALAEKNQRLPTDFPNFNTQATLAGSVAIGLTGCSRPFQGAIRDHVLGVTLVNGLAETIKGGGQVMKNVAGYDISRLMAGSRGTLGVMLDITLKVLPRSERMETRVFDMDENTALQYMNELAGKPLPITATVYLGGSLYLRLEGSESGVAHAITRIGGEALEQSEGFWHSINNHNHAFFDDAQSLWRIIVPTTTAKLELETDHEVLIDWCGGQRWLKADTLGASDYQHLRNVGGYIEPFRGQQPDQPESNLQSLQIRMQQRVKQAFDPDRIFNPVLSVAPE